MNFMQNVLGFLPCIGTGTKDLWLLHCVIAVPTLVSFHPHPHH